MSELAILLQIALNFSVHYLEIAQMAITVTVLHFRIFLDPENGMEEARLSSRMPI
jgi:hypothetical protein